MSTAPGGDRDVAARGDELIAEVLPAPLFVVQDQKLVYVNAAYAELVGVDRNDLIGRDSLEFVHPDDRSGALQWRSDWDGAVRTGALLPLRLQRRDGTERSVLVTTTRIVHHGRTAILGAATDVTGHPEAVAASVRMAAVGRLAGGVAHDFNNLLLVIGGQVERLQQELPPTHELRPAVDAIGTAAHRAATLTDQLLSIGRRQLLMPQVTDLSALVAEMETQLGARIGSSIALTLNRAPGVSSIRADRHRLVQVLRHLVDNARDAMPAGGDLTIAVDEIAVDAESKRRWPFLSAGGRFVRLRVVDSGGGMDLANLPHIFEPFFTTKGRGRGSGMGLASVYGIVKQSRGFVFVEYTGPTGTCITVLLPSLGGPEVGHDGAARPPAPPLLADQPRVLLVEDEMAVRELLAEMLTRNGFDVTVAETGEQATLIAAERSFELLLTDIDLPGMNGAHLAAALRRRFPQLIVVMMSGYPEDIELGDASPDDKRILLRKPFSTAQLLTRLREALSQPPRG